VREPLERIVCLTEEPTEILYLLGEQRRIVGISAYTERPAEAKRDKPVVSAFVGGSVRKIAALQPDLVIGFSDIQAKLAGQLIAAGLQVLIFNQRSLTEILDVILTVGRLVGAEQRARLLVEAYEARLAVARARSRARVVRPRVYFEEWDGPMISGIRWVSELIEAAGGADVFADRASEPMAKARIVTAEEICARAPEIVLASWCGKPFDRASFEARSGFDQLPAVRAGRVYELDPAIILQPGPACLSDGLDALERLLTI
jgi:iron complex transport system substrate-binding protein